MKHFSLDSEEASIVFVGSFNPAIFHPEWLVRQKLLPEDDIKGAKIEIVHNDISKFTLEWLGVDVLRNKITIRTNDPSKYSPLKDLMISVFKILEHTPITQLGMNLTAIFKIDTEENWHKIGDNLAPKMIWEKSMPERVGLSSLTVESPRPDPLTGKINVSLKSLSGDFYGVEIMVNNHVELISGSKSKEEIHDVPTIVAEYWDPALELARMIGVTTLSKAIAT